MIDFVEHDECRDARERRKAPRSGRYLLIRDDRAVEIGREGEIDVAETMVELKAGARHRAREPGFEMLARYDDDRARDTAFGMQRVREPRCEPRLTGARGSDEEAVPRTRPLPNGERFTLPHA